jgi:hypothetical protein
MQPAIFVATLTVAELRSIIAEEFDKKIQQNTPPADEVYLTPNETAIKLGITLQTLRNYTKLGKLVDHRIANTRKVFYKKSQIEAALTTFKKYKSCKAA